MARPDKDTYYLGIAKAISARSPCLRRQFGAIIVVGDAIVSTGYNGPARGVNNCSLGCLKDKMKAPSYSAYDWCPGVHAEENAVVNAARSGVSVLGGTIYVVGITPDGKETVSKPCNRCSRIIINAGIKKVVTIDGPGKVLVYNPEDWAKEDTKWYETNMKS
jgi:dCMP deaminase